MMSQRWHYLLWTALWAATALPALLIPLTPIDETRYVAVAWEMWLNGDYLVPRLNGEAYSHKPPLLFWLIHAGWKAFGVNDVWPRLMPALFALAALLLVHRIAGRLWPDRPRVALLAPILLLGAALWMFFTPALMFDIVLAFWVLVAVSGLLRTRTKEAVAGWFIFIAATALGLLTKGPVMLLHVAIPALLLPWLIPAERPERRLVWHGALLASMTCAVAVALAWALPAALAGGEDYARAILLEQTSDRMVNSFAHRAAWWWYLPLLPLALFPWLWWPRLWQATGRGARTGIDGAMRFCLAWGLLIFIAFCVISGKRLHYLIPLLPVFALVVARLVDGVDALRARDGLRQWPIALAFLLFAGAWLAAPMLAQALALPAWITELPSGVALLWLLAALLILIPRTPLPLSVRATQICAVFIVSFSLTRAIVFDLAGPSYDLSEFSRFVHAAEARGAMIAHVGSYHGQYSLSGRLTQPLTIITRDDIPAWLEAHPDGLVIDYRDEAHADGHVAVVKVAPYRSKWVLALAADVGAGIESGA